MSPDSQFVAALGIVLGLALVVLGVGAYVGSDFASATALIPAVFGVLVTAFGVVGRRGGRERLAVYGVGVLALVGVLGAARGVPDAIALVTGAAVESTVAAVANGALFLIGLVLLAAAASAIVGDR